MGDIKCAEQQLRIAYHRCVSFAIWARRNSPYIRHGDLSADRLVFTTALQEQLTKCPLEPVYNELRKSFSVEL